MDDSDDIRGLVARRMRELGLDQAEVSRALDRSRTYINDYLVRGSPRAMPNDLKIKLASLIKVPPSALGVPALVAVPQSQSGGMREEGALYMPGPNIAAPPPHIILWQIKTRVLDQHPRRIVPGIVVAMDINRVEPDDIPIGSIVVAQLCSKTGEVGEGYGTIFREFIPPNKLSTNSSGENEIFSLNDPSRPYIAVIKGTLAYTIDVAENGNRHDHEAHKSQL